MPTASRNRQQHPWNKWFKKGWKSFKLKAGKDFTCQITSMVVQLRRYAKEAGEEVSIYIEGTSLQVLNNRTHPQRKRTNK